MIGHPLPLVDPSGIVDEAERGAEHFLPQPSSNQDASVREIRRVLDTAGSAESRPVVMKLLVGRLRIDEDNLTTHAISWSSVRATAEIAAAGKWYYEVLIKFTDIAQIGFALDSFRAVEGSLDGVGDDGVSWGICLNRHQKWHGTHSSYGSGFTWGHGDVLGCMLDLDDGTISYSMNGRNIGKAFDDVRIPPGGRMFPAASLREGSAIFVFDPSKLRFMPSGFKSFSIARKMIDMKALLVDSGAVGSACLTSTPVDPAMARLQWACQQPYCVFKATEPDNGRGRLVLLEASANHMRAHHPDAMMDDGVGSFERVAGSGSGSGSSGADAGAGAGAADSAGCPARIPSAIEDRQGALPPAAKRARSGSGSGSDSNSEELDFDFLETLERAVKKALRAGLPGGRGSRGDIYEWIVNAGGFTEESISRDGVSARIEALHHRGVLLRTGESNLSIRYSKVPGTVLDGDPHLEAVYAELGAHSALTVAQILEEMKKRSKSTTLIRRRLESHVQAGTLTRRNKRSPFVYSLNPDHDSSSEPGRLGEQDEDEGEDEDEDEDGDEDEDEGVIVLDSDSDSEAEYSLDGGVDDEGDEDDGGGDGDGDESMSADHASLRLQAVLDCIRALGSPRLSEIREYIQQLPASKTHGLLVGKKISRILSRSVMRGLLLKTGEMFHYRYCLASDSGTSGSTAAGGDVKRSVVPSAQVARDYEANSWPETVSDIVASIVGAIRSLGSSTIAELREHIRKRDSSEWSRLFSHNNRVISSTLYRLVSGRKWVARSGPVRNGIYKLTPAGEKASAHFVTPEHPSAAGAVAESDGGGSSDGDEDEDGDGERMGERLVLPAAAHMNVTEMVYQAVARLGECSYAEVGDCVRQNFMPSFSNTGLGPRLRSLVLQGRLVTTGTEKPYRYRVNPTGGTGGASASVSVESEHKSKHDKKRQRCDADKELRPSRMSDICIDGVRALSKGSECGVDAASVLEWLQKRRKHAQFLKQSHAGLCRVGDQLNNDAALGLLRKVGERYFVADSDGGNGGSGASVGAGRYPSLGFDLSYVWADGDDESESESGDRPARLCLAALETLALHHPGAVSTEVVVVAAQSRGVDDGDGDVDVVRSLWALVRDGRAQWDCGWRLVV